LRGCDAIFQVVNVLSSQLKKPELLRAKNMRKHFGTMLQVNILLLARNLFMNEGKKEISYKTFQENSYLNNLCVVFSFVCLVSAEKYESGAVWPCVKASWPF
jgi:hypothetical protein